MKRKVGRNDPCPCGSGRKYKQCCGKSAAPPDGAPDSHENAVQRAMAWLAARHGNAFAEALWGMLEDSLLGLFEDDETMRAALADIDGELWTQIQINLTEWLLAAGDIDTGREVTRIADLLQGPRGPLLTVAQRAWLAQLATQPLRLYDVTDVAPGTSITVCDTLCSDAPPVVVTERSGSRSLRAGMQIGARLMEVAGGHQLSGAIYAFSPLSGDALLQDLRAMQAEAETDGLDTAIPIGLAIIDAWLEQFFAPPRIPDIVHASTGEPLLFITDHYEVADWDALAAALAGASDVEGDRDAGWSRLREGDDGLTRALATITPESGGRRLSVLYPTAGLAAQGRSWFDALAGGSVRFLLQDVSDPKGVLSHPTASEAAGTRDGGPPAGVDPDALAGMIETAIRRSYARWTDEPIPALGNRTPREAMQSAAGRERVKGLLRSYEDAEAQQAAQQGRREVSYQFLWDALGLAR